MKLEALLAYLWWAPWLHTANFWLDWSKDQRRPLFMRKFIRHPTDFPIEYLVDESSASLTRPLKNICAGGLCFLAEKRLAKGATINIHIPLGFHSPETGAFDARGVVAWCHPENGHFTVGVQFDDQSTQFGVRMIEQVCHIERYRAQRAVEGRELSSEEAAREWVELYADEFPE